MENQLCDILRNINASANFGRGLGVSFPIFDGSENVIMWFFNKRTISMKQNISRS